MSNFNFKWVRSGEEIVKVLHRHWFNILQQFFIIFLLSFIMAGGFFFLPTFSSFFGDGKENIAIFIESIFFLFIWTYVFFIWIDYYFDIWVITKERIVNVEQKGLFMRHLSELKFEKIQDVTVEVEGLIPTILNYGDVYVQTAGEKERFVFRQIPNPYGVKDLIMSFQKKARAIRESDGINKEG